VFDVLSVHHHLLNLVSHSRTLSCVGRGRLQERFAVKEEMLHTFYQHGCFEDKQVISLPSSVSTFYRAFLIAMFLVVAMFYALTYWSGSVTWLLLSMSVVFLNSLRKT